MWNVPLPGLGGVSTPTLLHVDRKLSCILFHFLFVVGGNGEIEFSYLCKLGVKLLEAGSSTNSLFQTQHSHYPAKPYFSMSYN